MVGCRAGAHSFVGDIRWVECQACHLCGQLGRDQAPIADFERLDRRDRHVEEVLLCIRLRDGLPVTALTAPEQQRAANAVTDGLLTRNGDRLVLTDRGRLLADSVVRQLLDD